MDREVVKLQQENKRQRQDREGDREERQRVEEVVNNLWQAVDGGKGGRCEVQPVPAYWDDGHASNHYTGIATDTSHSTHTHTNMYRDKQHTGTTQAPYWLPITRLDLHHKGFPRTSAGIGIRCQPPN